ncbi:hypothetical protein TCAL_10757 [Tigriopus californicus]|uniref:Uncharacterized protein n=1 Tax=Tigriopus californicus TaxID=6832 RepID=A0A553NVN6_TIGCA|nr:uncharacterized protein LOC131880229 [Tigriopus californicus]TRY69494.1 hypothetical protein TCAL_10757 [Tigriopus californicus]|eukprot:TCALIF_10757-PA protein Name:"Similar to WDY WD repeat-containing protein on Y chromosome (Drosophila virilis)" AED:0.28 eAED:0.30 QI:0/-1/0/1/-1/1/1/0/820
MPSSDSEKTSADHHSTFEKSSSTTSSVCLGQGLIAALQGVDFLSNQFYKKLAVEDLAAIKAKFRLERQPAPFNKSGRAKSNFVAQDSLDSPQSANSINSANVDTNYDTHVDQDEDDPMSMVPKHSMSLENWVSTITSLFGTPNIAEDAAAMFKQMDAKEARGFVQWEDVLNLYIDNMTPSSLHREIKFLSHKGHFNRVEHTKRETVQKILVVDTGLTIVYILVSKFGHVGIYDDRLRLQRRYDIDIDTDPNADLNVAASDPGWVTDAFWMDNSKHAIYCTSLRTMHFFDASASVHYEEYRAFGFISIPTCLDYWFNEDDLEGESLFFFGNDTGGVSVVTFKQPLNSLFRKDEVDNVQCIFWPEIGKHHDYLVVDHTSIVHRDAVLGLKYLSRNNTIITTSRDPESSVVIRHLKGKLQSYIFKLQWGVRCFDFATLNGLSYLATGSNDKIVRLWNPVVISKPILIFSGHKYGLAEVKIQPERTLLISYDKHAIVKVWDLEQGYCVQSLTLAFPSFKVLGKEIEFGKPSFYTQTASPTTLIATCCDLLAVIKFDDLEIDQSNNKPSVESASQSEDQTLLCSPHFGPGALLLDPLQSFTLGKGTKAIPSSGSIPVGNLASPRSIGTHSTRSSPRCSDLSRSSGWSSVRNIIRNRRAGKLRHHPSMDSDAGYEQFRHFHHTSANANEETSSLNVLRVTKYFNSSKLRRFAKDKMPFLGLEICGLQELDLHTNLPLPSSFIQQGITIANVEDLMALSLGESSQKLDDPGEADWESSNTTKLDQQESKPRKLPGNRRASISIVQGDAKTLPIIAERADTSTVAKKS